MKYAPVLNAPHFAEFRNLAGPQTLFFSTHGTTAEVVRLFDSRRLFKRAVSQLGSICRRNLKTRVPPEEKF